MAALQDLIERVHAAVAGGRALSIRGGGTKDFYGEPPRGAQLSTLGHADIVSNEPSELVVTVRWTLKEGLTSLLFAPAMKMGQLVRGLLPQKLKAKVPAPRPAGEWPMRSHARKDQEGGKAQMRANIDAWWPHVEAGEVEAIVMNASGYGVTVREYAHVLREDPAYARKAARISELTRDLSELLPDLVPLLKDRVKAPRGVVGYHPPCTLQHGQKLRGSVEVTLRALGFDIQVAKNEPQLCCGSAGTYSVLQPELAYSLRDRKLGYLGQLTSDTIIWATSVASPTCKAAPICRCGIGSRSWMRQLTLLTRKNPALQRALGTTCRPKPHG